MLLIFLIFQVLSTIGGFAVRAIENWLNRFTLKHPRFGIPNLMNVLVIGTMVVFLLDQFSGYSASALLFFHRNAIFSGQIWRLLTFVFVPDSQNLFTLVISLYFYWWIGSSLEREWGTARFNVFYFLGVILNILFGLVAGTVTNAYLNLSMFFAFAVLYPDLQVLLFFFIPIKVKWLAWADAFLFALAVVFNLFRLNFVSALLPLIAILNFLLFFWSDLMDQVQYRRNRFQRQHSHQTIDFKRAAQQVHQKGYIHKCAVCGKTDTEYPDMEFRYCSKCNGYYCYCKDHIHNHVHIP